MIWYYIILYYIIYITYIKYYIVRISILYFHIHYRFALRLNACLGSWKFIPTQVPCQKTCLRSSLSKVCKYNISVSKPVYMSAILVIIEMLVWNGFALPHWLLPAFYKFQACTTHTLIQRLQSLYSGHTNTTRASTCLPEKPPGTY